MPDETTNTDTPVAAEVPMEAVDVEPTTVAEPEPVVVVEPVIESASPRNPEEFPATQIDSFPSVSLSENISSSVVAEVQVVSEPELPVSVRAESAVEALVSAVADSVQPPEQLAEIAQPSVVAPVDDFGLTPQLPVNEALTPENTPEKQPLEQPSVPIVLDQESAPEPVKVGIPLKNVVSVYYKKGDYETCRSPLCFAD